MDFILKQKQTALIRQLEEELRLTHMRNPDQEVQQHMEALYNEKEHMSKEIYLLRETIKVNSIFTISSNIVFVFENKP